MGSQETAARKKTRASWECVISEWDQRIRRCGDRKPGGSRRWGETGSEERDESSEVNLINGKVKIAIQKPSNRGENVGNERGSRKKGAKRQGRGGENKGCEMGGTLTCSPN